jgi:hypothetical protein
MEDRYVPPKVLRENQELSELRFKTRQFIIRVVEDERVYGRNHSKEDFRILAFSRTTGYNFFEWFYLYDPMPMVSTQNILNMQAKILNFFQNQGDPIDFFMFVKLEYVYNMYAYITDVEINDSFWDRILVDACETDVDDHITTDVDDSDV